MVIGSPPLTPICFHPPPHTHTQPYRPRILFSIWDAPRNPKSVSIMERSLCDWELHRMGPMACAVWLSHGGLKRWTWTWTREMDMPRTGQDKGEIDVACSNSDIDRWHTHGYKETARNTHTHTLCTWMTMMLTPLFFNCFWSTCVP